MQILGLEKVRIMRFSGRKGEIEGRERADDSIVLKKKKEAPRRERKKSGKYYLPVKEERSRLIIAIKSL